MFCQKYRFGILKGQRGRTLREILRQLCEWKKIEILAGNIQVDHIHLVLSLLPKYAFAEVVGFLTEKSAIKLFDKHVDLKKRYWGRHFWTKGYCVSTVGLDEEKIKRYVTWQLNKDRDMKNSE